MFHSSYRIANAALQEQHALNKLAKLLGAERSTLIVLDCFLPSKKWVLLRAAYPYYSSMHIRALAELRSCIIAR